MKDLVLLIRADARWALPCSCGIGLAFAVVLLMYALVPLGLGVTSSVADGVWTSASFFAGSAVSLAVCCIVIRQAPKKAAGRNLFGIPQAVILALGGVLVALHGQQGLAGSSASLAMGVGGGLAMGLAIGCAPIETARMLVRLRQETIRLVVCASVIPAGLVTCCCVAIAHPIAFAICMVLPVAGCALYSWGDAHVDYASLDDPNDDGDAERDNADQSEGYREDDDRGRGERHVLGGQATWANSWRAAGSFAASMLVLSGIMTFCSPSCLSYDASDVSPLSPSVSQPDSPEVSMGSSASTSVEQSASVSSGSVISLAQSPRLQALSAALAMAAAFCVLVALSDKAKTISLTLVFRVSLPVLGVACLVEAFASSGWSELVVFVLGMYVAAMLEYGIFLLAVGWQSDRFLSVELASIPIPMGHLVLAVGTVLNYLYLLRAGSASTLVGVDGAMDAPYVAGVDSLLRVSGADLLPALFCEMVVLMVTFVLCVPSQEPHLADPAMRGNVGLRNLTSRDRARYSLTILDHGLTAREAEVMMLLLEGRTAHEISEELYVSRATVNTHVHHIYEKYGVHSRDELATAVKVYNATAAHNTQKTDS